MGIFDRFKAPATTRQEFVAMARKVLAKLDEVASTEAGDDFSIVVTRTDGGGHTTYLANIWRQLEGRNYAEQRAGLEEFLGHMTQGAEAVDGWEAARERLFPALRGGGYLTAFAMEDDGPIRRAALPSLCQVLCLDGESTVSTLARSSLDEWGVSEAEAWAAADDNLKRHSRPIIGSDPGTVHRIVTTALDAASLLLAPGWLHACGGSLRTIAWVPDRDSLSVLVYEGEAPIESLAPLARQEWEEAPRSVSPVLYTTDSNGSVVPFVSTEPAQTAMLDHARYVLALAEYQSQKAAIDAYHEEHGIDLYVAKYMVFDGDAGMRSVAVWPEDCEGLIPAADVIALLGSGPEPREVPLETVLAHTGLKPVKGLFPLRYRVGTWPDALRD